MEFANNLFLESGRILRRCVALAASAVVFDLALTIAVEAADFFKVLNLGVILLWTCLALEGHRQVLKAPYLGAARYALSVFGFFWRTIGLTLLGALPAILVFLLFEHELRLLAAALEDPNHFRILVLLFFCLSFLSVCSAAGTLLPAYVAGEDGSLVAALDRSKTLFFWLFGRLLIGPGLLYSIALLILAFGVLLSPSGGLVWSEQHGLDLVFVTATILSLSIQAYATILAAVILSRAFLRHCALLEEKGVPLSVAG